jgi:hypothetical protein
MDLGELLPVINHSPKCWFRRTITFFLRELLPNLLKKIFIVALYETYRLL